MKRRTRATEKNLRVNFYFQDLANATNASVMARSIKPHSGRAGMASASFVMMVDVEVLFAGVESTSAAETVAVFTNVPAVDGAVMTIVAVALPPLPSVPIEQVTLAVPLHVP
jgi:hypothetical protein